MNRTTLFTALVLSLVPAASMAYNESDETRFPQDWFEQERARTDGNTAPPAKRDDTVEHACRTPRERSQFADFLAQLSLTEGGAHRAPISQSTPETRYAAGSGRGEPENTMTC